MQLAHVMVPTAGACLMGVALFVDRSPWFQLLLVAGLLMASVPVVRYIGELVYPYDPYRKKRRSAG